jgi:hypothetical protein
VVRRAKEAADGMKVDMFIAVVNEMGKSVSSSKDRGRG